MAVERDKTYEPQGIPQVFTTFVHAWDLAGLVTHVLAYCPHVPVAASRVAVANCSTAARVRSSATRDPRQSPALCRA